MRMSRSRCLPCTEAAGRPRVGRLRPRWKHSLQVASAERTAPTRSMRYACASAMITLELSSVAPDPQPLLPGALVPSLEARGLRRVLAASAPEGLVEAMPL